MKLKASSILTSPSYTSPSLNTEGEFPKEIEMILVVIEELPEAVSITPTEETQSYA